MPGERVEGVPLGPGEAVDGVRGVSVATIEVAVVALVKGVYEV